MAYITKYGSFWGFIPQTSGNVYWVAPSASYTVEGRTYSASDDNDGLSPERAVLTLDRAIDLATASVGDVIVLLPGSHSWSATAAVDKAGLTITGIPSGSGHPQRQRTSITTSASDQVLNITAADIELAYLNVIPVTTMAGIDLTAAADRVYVHDCSFDMYTAATSTATKGLVSLATSGSVAKLYIDNCYFESDGAQGPALDLTYCHDARIKNCEFVLQANATAAWAEAVVATTGAVGVLMEHCRFIHGTTTVITEIIDWTGTTDDASLILHDVVFAEGSIVQASADNDVMADNTSFAVQIANGGATSGTASGSMAVVNAS
jgi:hypothetical protein